MEEVDPADREAQGYSLLPQGSTRELGSHKGYGLSCVVDILAGVLTGVGYGAVPGRPNFRHYAAAYSIDAFTDVDSFKDMMDEGLRMMKGTKPARGQERVLVAGQARGRGGGGAPRGWEPVPPRGNPVDKGHLWRAFGALPGLTRKQSRPLGVRSQANGICCATSLPTKSARTST